MGARDVAAQYAGLETRVGGIEKTVDNLGRYMRDETSALRREMADGNAGLKAEMTAQNSGILTALEKLTQTAATSNNALRTEFNNDIKAVSDKQGMRANTLIALCTLGLGAIGYFMSMNNRPTDAAIADLKASLTDLKSSTAKNESDFVPKAQIERMQAEIDRHEASIIPDRDAQRIRQLLDDAQRKRDAEAAEDRANLKEIDERLRAVEVKTAK